MRIKLVVLVIILNAFAFLKVSAAVNMATSVVRFIGVDTAVAGGKIINTGGEAVVEAGVCYSKNSNPTIFDNVVERRAATDSFSCTLKNLNPEQIYYVRSYAVTASGFHYGPQQIFATAKLEWGVFTHGGYLFYLLQPGDPGYLSGEFHGLVYINSIGMNGSFTWGNGVDTFLNVTDSNMFTGRENTNKIVAALGEGSYAAKYCYDLARNGYSDWYMPSSLELFCLYINNNIGGVSSTEVDKKYAIRVNGKRKLTILKTVKTGVTAIRQF